jgi:hypothetical protein
LILDLLTLLRTTSNYIATANLHTFQIIRSPAKPFSACCVLTGRFLATASNSGDSSTSRIQVLLSQPPMKGGCQLLQLPTVNYQLNSSAISCQPSLQSSILDCQSSTFSYSSTQLSLSLSLCYNRQSVGQSVLV